MVKAVGQLSGDASGWQCVNEQQEQFRRLFHVGDLPLLPEVSGTASEDASDLMRFIEAHGVKMELPPVTGLGAVGILDYATLWKMLGKPVDIIGRDWKTYEGVRLEDDDVAFVRYAGHPYTVARVQAKGDVICMVMTDDAMSGLALYQFVERLMKTKAENRDDHFCALCFPKVAWEQVEGQSWLLGLGFGDGLHVDMALQHNRVSLDEKGVVVKSVSVVYASFGACGPVIIRKPLEIDRPFVFWVERPGVRAPLVVGYFDYGAWQPKDNKNV